ncbi:MAG: endonuclease [Chitinophagales bacterium]
MKKSFALLLVLLHAWSFAGALATEPTAQPTNLTFGGLKAYTFILSFTPVTADGYLILKSSSPIAFTPVDGTAYEKGQGLAGSKVMYTGPNSNHSVKEVLEGTEYFFKIFAYNGSGSNINYLQTNPLAGSVTSTASSPGAYYQGVDSSSGTFLADLHTLINNHTMVAYVAYKSNIVPNIFERDTVGGKVVINCEYSNETTIYSAPFDFTVQAYNREHVLCKSWMQTAAALGANNLINYAEGADYYNLLLTRSTPNQVRSNNPLGIVLQTASTYGESKFGQDNTGNSVFEPKNNRKGDAARAMFYEMVCYNGLSGGWGLDQLLSEANTQDQNVLKLWNQQDPPDKFERTKNEYINSLQHNRNPFIDHPEWATCINFDSLVKTNLCGAISGVNDMVLNRIINVYPNPAANVLNIDMPGSMNGNITLTVMDMTGRTVTQRETTDMFSSLDVSSLENGHYLLQISMNGQSAYRKFMILH